MYFGRKRKYAAKLRAQERKKPSRIISLLLVISMLCGNFVGMSTGAAEMVAYCGMEEHTHSEACYCAVQAEGEAAAETLAAAVPTEETAAETTEETTAPTEETALSVSGGSDAQALIGEYVEKELCCGMEEHKHDIACYSNPLADLETAAIWEATLPEKLSGDWGKDLAEVAKSQLGYAESAANYLVGADGETLMGYSRYGAWYSSYTQDEKQAYADWNVPFLFFCLYYAGVEDFPIEEDCADWTAALAAAELWREAAGEYIPEAGDLVFLDTDDDGAADRAAVVTEYSEAKVTAVESDSEGAVKTVTYDLTEDTQVLGYGDTNEAQAQIEVSGGEDAPTLLNNTELTIYFAGWQDWDSYGVNAKVLRGDGNNWQTVAMTKTNDTYTRDGITYNVYSAKVYEIYGGFDQVLFYKGGTDFCYTANNSWVTKDVIEGKIYVPEKGWYSDYSSGSGGGGGTTGTVVDINSEAFSPADDTYYVNASFYDYYTEYESNGNNLDSNTHGWKGNNGSFASFDDWYVFDDFNAALSEYYSRNGVKYPLYMGHFQPNWGDMGYKFIDHDRHSLYGFQQSGTYGINNDWQQNFMSVNNSLMDLDPETWEIEQNARVYSAAQGLVHSQLVNDSLMSVTSGGTVAMPLFNAAFVNGTYQNKKIGDVYEKVSFPFTKEDINGNGVEYWVFDSEDTTLEMKKDSNSVDEYFLQSVAKDNKYKNLNSASAQQSAYGFFPFNSGSSQGNANTYNYGFGCRLDIPFRLTSDGKVLDKNGNKVPIEFEFSGDDDVWVFIDGKLVLDIGGSHGRVTGTINFAGEDGATRHMDVSATKSNPGNTTNTEKTTFTLTGKNTDEHTLTMFYMERGMWESNMRVTFNFPDENQLEVEKDLDLTGVNSLFTNAFANQKIFTFNIKNLATHYAAKAVANSAVSPISVDGYASHSYNGNIFNKGTYQGYGSTFHWYAGGDDLDNSGSSKSTWRHRRYGVMTLNNTVNISNMSKLSFYLYYNDSNGFSLNDLYLQLLSSNVPSGDLIGSSSTSGDSYALGSLGTSSLSGKTYGSINTSGNTWVKVTLDLSKLSKGSNFNNTAVKYIRFGCDYGKNIYLRGFTFEPAAQESFEVGFVTKQYDIPDYGSIAAKGLVNPTGAVYTSNMFTGAHVIGSDGTFALEDGEIVNFHDQFRRGSYIYLEEVLTAKENALYDTTWTMYENDKAVTYMADDGVVNVSSSSYDVVDVASNLVNDGRSEVYKTGTDSDGKTLNNSGYTSTARPSAGGFVFRSYADPDSADTTTKLKVKFTNTVNTANLTIAKADKTGDISSSETFTFKILFYNVGGVGLESSTITHTVTLRAGQSTTISGIPVNTQYAIYELQNNDEIVLDSVSGAHDAFYATTYGGTDAYMVGGSLGTTDKSVTFTNVKKPTISLKVTKEWEDTDGTALTNTPSTIFLRLLYRKAGTTTWEPYESASGFTGYQTVALTPGYGAWEYTFTPLDVYVDYPDDQTKWEYKVIELDPVEFDEVTDLVTIDGTEYKVTYTTPTTVANGGVSQQTITNTLNSNTTFTVTKNWVYADGVTPVTDYTLVPATVTVQLWRQVEGGTASSCDTYTLNPAEDGKTWATYAYTFEDLDKSDANGKEYTYFVREMNGVNKLEEGGTFTVNDNVFTVSYGEVTGDSDEGFGQTITNQYAPKVDIPVTKNWTGNNSGTVYTGTDIPESIWVRLQRKTTNSDWLKVQDYQLKKSESWMYTFEDQDAVTESGVAYTYRVVELTGENGTVVTAGNSVEYDGVSFKVTYSNPLSPGSNEPITTDWIITNQVTYTVSLDITKLATDTNAKLGGVAFRLEKVDGTYTTVDTTFTALTATTDSQGKATFSDLKDGYYLLTETQTANGYSLLAEPIKVKVESTQAGSYDVYVNGTKQNTSTTNSVITCALTVYNKPQLVMPPTGGVGGFEFWILGGLLIMAVPLLMYTFIWYRKGGKYLQR